VNSRNSSSVKLYRFMESCILVFSKIPKYLSVELFGRFYCYRSLLLTKNAFCCLICPLKVASVDMSECILFHSYCNTFSLFLPCLIERDITMSLNKVIEIVICFTMADEIDPHDCLYYLKRL